MALARSTSQSNSVRNADENLDDSRYCGKLVKEREKYEEKMCGYFQGTIANGYGNDFSKRSGKNVRPNVSDHITISEGGTHPKTDRCNYIG